MMVEMMVEMMAEQMRTERTIEMIAEETAIAAQRTIDITAEPIQKTPPTPHHLDSSVSQSAGTQR